MAWDPVRALGRIRKFAESVPETSIQVQDFATEYLPRRRRLAEAKMLSVSASAVVNIPRNQALLTHGVHIYADLMDFGQKLSAAGRDTEHSQELALQTLHLHYGGCDRLIEAFDIQRVDFHGSRLHAVVLTPTGVDQEYARVLKAIAFATELERIVQRNNERFGGRLASRVCIGIDSGPAAAINSGRGREQEPLFIGSPANHAAHLAMSEEPGQHLSKTVRLLLSKYDLRWICTAGSKSSSDEALDIRQASGYSIRDRLVETLATYESSMQDYERLGAPAVFNFHAHEPPLRSLKFEDLPPSNAVRMPMASIFADLDGYTRFIDASITAGDIRKSILALHILRGEFAAVIRDDFGGRKVRYIGDCIHAVLSIGTGNSVNASRSVQEAVLAAGGLRSSFELAKEELRTIDSLGLAIGIDFGQTPACRIGLRGDGSVRSVVSTATRGSENQQQLCNGSQTGLAKGAHEHANFALKRAFGTSSILPGLTYPSAIALTGGLPMIKVGDLSAPPIRAYCL